MDAWFRDPGNQVIALFAALLLVGIARLPRFLAWLRRFQFAGFGPVGAPGIMRESLLSRLGLHHRAVPPPPRPATIPGAGTALAHPPGVEESLEYMLEASPRDRYLLPLGWLRDEDDTPDLVHTALVGETNHVLISGASDSGKDNLAWWMLLSLALVHHDPQQLQVAIIDGKGLDFHPWQAKAQTWALATDPEEIPTILRALSAERQRRKAVLAAAGVSKWDHYQGGDLPLLVVFISELSLLETALKRERSRRERDRSLDVDLELWLNTELTAGRAFGIRYLIGMQTVTGMDMLWRSQIGVFLGGYQPDESQVKPNTSKTAKQIVAAGAIPPNLLPAPPLGAGVVTIVSGEQCATVRSPYLSDAERRRWLALLPERPHAPVLDTASGELLASLIADANTRRSTASFPAEASVSGETAPVNTDDAELPFTTSEVAVIAARIARGETKTEVVRTMPGYGTRRHREFVAYYDRIATTLAEAGLTETGPGVITHGRTS